MRGCWGTCASAQAALHLSVSCGLGGKRAFGGLSAEIPVELHVSEASPKGLALALYCGVIESEVNALGSVASLFVSLPLFLWPVKAVRS